MPSFTSKINPLGQIISLIFTPIILQPAVARILGKFQTFLCDTNRIADNPLFMFVSLEIVLHLDSLHSADPTSQTW